MDGSNIQFLQLYNLEHTKHNPNSLNYNIELL